MPSQPIELSTAVIIGLIAMMLFVIIVYAFYANAKEVASVDFLRAIGSLVGFNLE